MHMYHKVLIEYKDSLPRYNRTKKSEKEIKKKLGVLRHSVFFLMIKMVCLRMKVNY